MRRLHGGLPIVLRRVVGFAMVFGAALTAGPAAADEVRVEGRTYTGTVVEVRPRVLVRIWLADGTELKIPWSAVVAVDGAPRDALESGTPPLRTQEQTARAAPRTHWYGWQTLLVDGGSLLLLLNQSTAIYGLATYVLAPPIVHVAHAQWAPAVGSVLVRLALPFFGALIGGSIGGANDVGAELAGIFGGALLGMGAASAVDASLLAWEPDRSRPSTKDAADAAPSIALAPVLSTTADVHRTGRLGGLALVGTF